MAKKKKKKTPSATAARPKPPKVQSVIGDAFPDRDPALEGAVVGMIKADDRKQAAADRRTTAYDALKELMRKSGLAKYYSYDARVRVVLTSEDAKVKLQKIKDEDATPYRQA